MTFTNRTGGNPIANALVVVVGTIAILASIVLGFFAAVVLGVALLVLAAIVGIRLWWLGRKGQGVEIGVRPRQSTDRKQTIEGEYRVVIEEREDDAN